MTASLPVSPTASQVGLLLFVAALVAMLMRRLRLPYTVGLVVAGMALHFAHVRLSLHLSRDLVFFFFLPPLIFEAALSLDWGELRKDLVLVIALATVGVAVAATVTAVGMRYALSWDWGSALLFGILIAATDPVAVIATLKEAGASGRLRLLLEAESLLNDATAAVGFVAVLGVISGTGSGLGAAGLQLVASIGGGILIGTFAAAGFMLLAGRTQDALTEITLSTLAAFGSFYVAEQLHVSGILAALTSGLVIGNTAMARSVSAAGRPALHGFWTYAAFVANSLIFLLIGTGEAATQYGGVVLSAAVAVIAALVGRAAAVYGVCASFGASRYRVGFCDQHVLVWGGLRGALALALGLALPAEVPRRDEIIASTFAVVAFSVFAQGLSIRPLLSHMGLLLLPKERS